jgi:hypothetical protein
MREDGQDLPRRPTVGPAQSQKGGLLPIDGGNAMNVTMLDRFLEKLAQNPDMQREFIEFAARHGIDFSAREVSDRELDGVAGGIDPIPIPMPTGISRGQLPLQQQTLSNISRMLHNMSMSMMGNLR